MLTAKQEATTKQRGDAKGQLTTKAAATNHALSIGPRKLVRDGRKRAAATGGASPLPIKEVDGPTAGNDNGRGRVLAPLRGDVGSLRWAQKKMPSATFVPPSTSTH